MCRVPGVSSWLAPDLSPDSKSPGQELGWAQYTLWRGASPACVVIHQCPDSALASTQCPGPSYTGLPLTTRSVCRYSPLWPGSRVPATRSWAGHLSMVPAPCATPSKAATSVTSIVSGVSNTVVIGPWYPRRVWVHTSLHLVSLYGCYVKFAAKGALEIMINISTSWFL